MELPNCLLYCSTCATTLTWETCNYLYLLDLDYVKCPASPSGTAHKPGLSDSPEGDARFFAELCSLRELVRLEAGGEE